MRGWWLVFLCLGCGDNSSEISEGARDGARIKVGWFEFEDGTRTWEPRDGEVWSPQGWLSTKVFYDTELDSECRSRPWTDGTRRCMPPTQVNELAFYADAGCTKRVTPDPGEFRFAGEVQSACNELRLEHVYPIEQVTSGGTVYVLDEGRCVDWFADYDQFGVLGAELPASRFVAMATTHSDDDDRMHVRYDESEDGMRVPMGLYDSLLGPADLRDMYAIPKQPSFEISYTDEQCQQRVVRVDEGCAPPATAYGGGYSPVRDRVAVTSLYAGTGPASCAPYTPLPGDYYSVDSNSYPVADMVTTTDDVHGRRLQLRHAYIGARPVRASELVDTQLGIECVPFEFPDGAFRCIEDPDRAYVDRGGKYADPACQTPIDVIHVFDGEPPMFVVDDRRSTGGTLRIIERGAWVAAPIYIMGDTCNPYPNDRVYHFGAEVPWDTFARASRTIAD